MLLRMAWYHAVSRVVPSPQEISQLDQATLDAEIAAVADVLADRYNPNGTFAQLCDGLRVDGRGEQRAFWADLTRYQANLHNARRIKSLEPGGIGMLDVRTNDETQNGSSAGGYYW